MDQNLARCQRHGSWLVPEPITLQELRKNAAPGKLLRPGTSRPRELAAQVRTLQELQDTVRQRISVPNIAEQPICLMTNHVRDAPRPCSHDGEASTSGFDKRAWKIINAGGVYINVVLPVQRRELFMRHSPIKSDAAQAPRLSQTPKPAGFGTVSRDAQHGVRDLSLNELKCS